MHREGTGGCGAHVKLLENGQYAVEVWQTEGHMDRKVVGIFSRQDQAVRCAKEWKYQTYD